MKKWFVVVALVIVLFASLAQAQTPAASASKASELTIEQKYAAERIGRLNLIFQMFQGDIQAMVRKYPDFAKILQGDIQEAAKQLQPEIDELQKKLPQAPAPPPAKKVSP